MEGIERVAAVALVVSCALKQLPMQVVAAEDTLIVSCLAKGVVFSHNTKGLQKGGAPACGVAGRHVPHHGGAPTRAVGGNPAGFAHLGGELLPHLVAESSLAEVPATAPARGGHPSPTS